MINLAPVIRRRCRVFVSELSHALYQHDAGCRVIARLTKEVTAAREGKSAPSTNWLVAGHRSLLLQASSLICIINMLCIVNTENVYMQVTDNVFVTPHSLAMCYQGMLGMRRWCFSFVMLTCEGIGWVDRCKLL